MKNKAKERKSIFMKKIQKGNDILLSIMNHLDNHMEVDAENITWGNIGNINHVIEQLNDVKDFLNI